MRGGPSETESTRGAISTSDRHDISVMPRIASTQFARQAVWGGFKDGQFFALHSSAATHGS